MRRASLLACSTLWIRSALISGQVYGVQPAGSQTVLFRCSRLACPTPRYDVPCSFLTPRCPHGAEIRTAANLLNAVMAIVLALGAALMNALSTILERLGVQSAPEEHRLRLGLILYALRRAVWLAGFGVMTVAAVAQFAALHFGQLTEVQPILTLELPALVVILWLWFRQKLGWRDWVGTLAATGGLWAFLAASDVTGGTSLPSAANWVEVGVACGGLTAVSIALAQRGSHARKAAWYGVASAVSFAFTAALERALNLYMRGDWVHVFGQWELYVLAVVGLGGFFLAQNAFHAGSVTASQSTMVTIDPIASILLGVGLFGDGIDTAGARAVVEPIALLVLFGGVLLLASSPLVAHSRGELVRPAKAGRAAS